MTKRYSTVDSALLLAVAAAFLYLVGWVHLHSYLDAFGVEISELDLDVHTVLVYALPAILAVVKILVPVLLIVGIVAWGLKSSFPAFHQWLLDCREVCTRQRNHTLWTALIAIALTLLVLRVVRCFAEDLASQKWEKSGIDLTAVLYTPPSGIGSEWHSHYLDCANRQVLDLVFADRSRYYLLCISALDASSGVIFEIRKESGLASIRRLVRPTN